MTINVTMQKLELHHQFITLEEVQELHAGSAMISKIGNMLTDSASYIKDKFKNIFKPTDKVEHYLGFSAFSSKHKYLDSSAFILQVPEGFTGNLYDYAKLLETISTKYIKTFEVEVLRPFDLYISKLVNDPMLLESVTFKPMVNFKDIEKYNKDLSKFVFKGKHTTLSLKECVNNMKQLKDVGDSLNNINATYKRIDIIDIKDKVYRLNDKMTILNETINSGKYNINFKEKNVKELADLTMDLAKQIEFFTIIHQVVVNLNTVMEVNDEVLSHAK